MRLLLTGLSHHTAPVDVRERLAIPEGHLGEALAALRAEPGVDEAVILSTCNRVELAVTSQHSDPGLAIDGFLSRFRGLDMAELDRHLYRHGDEDAIRHIFRVAASLDSMVLGEPQILGQLKAAYSAAKETGAVHGYLEAVLTRAFSVAKRVRSETDIGRSAVSVSYAAIELARQIFGQLDDKRVLLIGAGKMSELAARHLRRAGCAKIFVTNRTVERALEMAALVEGEVISYALYHQRLAEMDIVLTSSGAPDYLLRRDQMRQVLDRRRNRPMFLIDIAVPRNIDPEVNQLDNVFLYDIDDLGRAVEENRKARLKEAQQAEQIIEEEIRRLVERLKAREVAPTIVGLQQQFDELARAEFERVRGRMGALTPQQEEALQAYTRGLLNKIAHGPIHEIRQAAAKPEGDHIIRLVRRMFRLEEG
jgi:glutamyl-tRNA reductase